MARVLAAIATAVAVCLLVPAQPAAADGYGPSVASDTQISIDADCNRAPVTVAVRGNAEGETPEGNVEVVVENTGPVTTGGGQSVLQRDIAGTALATQIYAQSVEYDGTPVVIDLGTLPAGEYEVRASFTPAPGSSFLPAEEQSSFTVSCSTQQQTAADTSVGGVLPNTGGPQLAWLLLGLGLLGGGAVVTHRARRSATR